MLLRKILTKRIALTRLSTEWFKAYQNTEIPHRFTLCMVETNPVAFGITLPAFLTNCVPEEARIQCEYAGFAV